MNYLKIEYLPVESLKPYEKNTRRHGELDVNNIAKSIEKYGFNDAIGIWGGSNLIVEGHGRLLAAKKLGIKEVPCVRLDHLTEDQRREYAIAHNATAELSSFDFEIMKEEIEGLDLEDFDFDLNIEACGLIDYMKNDIFVNEEKNPKEFSVTLTFDINYKEEIDSYLKENGKGELIKACIGVIENA